MCCNVELNLQFCHTLAAVTPFHFDLGLLTSAFFFSRSVLSHVCPRPDAKC